MKMTSLSSRLACFFEYHMKKINGNDGHEEWMARNAVAHSDAYDIKTYNEAPVFFSTRRQFFCHWLAFLKT